MFFSLKSSSGWHKVAELYVRHSFVRSISPKFVNVLTKDLEVNGYKYTGVQSARTITLDSKSKVIALVYYIKCSVSQEYISKPVQHIDFKL